MAASTRPRTVTGQAAALDRDAAIGFVHRYHRLAVTVDAPPPPGPALLVANHGFGGITDLNVFAALAALDTAGLDAPLDIQVHQLAWTLGVGPALEEIGCRPAGRDTAAASLENGHHLLVLPGGDLDAFKPHSQRNRIGAGDAVGGARRRTAARRASRRPRTHGPGWMVDPCANGWSSYGSHGLRYFQ